MQIIGDRNTCQPERAHIAPLRETTINPFMSIIEIYRMMKRSKLRAHAIHALIMASLIAALATPTKATAEWLNQSESGMFSSEAWVYRPEVEKNPTNSTSTSVLPDPSLLVVLHGCVQTGQELIDSGNLKAAADTHNFFVMVPTVDYYGKWKYGCWAYDPKSEFKTGQVQHNIDRISQLTKKAADTYKIPHTRVYITGLSSGGALSLRLGCTYPDIFAGVGAIAGPSVGSDQWLATADPAIILESNVDETYESCLKLAEKNPAGGQLKKQIVNIAHGLLDGPDDVEHDKIEVARHEHCIWEDWPFGWLACPVDKHPGQYSVVSKKYSRHNAKAFAKISGAARQDNLISIQNGSGIEWSWKVDGGQQSVGFLLMPNVGHAWPAGMTPQNNPVSNWIMQGDINYPEYIMTWFTSNNRRTQAQNAQPPGQ